MSDLTKDQVMGIAGSASVPSDVEMLGLQDCEACGHALDRHGVEGCEVEMAALDGTAYGPCRCQSYEVIA